MTIEMTPSDSSMIRAHGHDPQTNRLRLEFKDGVQHDYANVTRAKYEHFLKAEDFGGSLGKYFHAHFKRSAAHPSLAV